MDDEFDLEELEWRLYSQVYHSSCENDNTSVHENILSYGPLISENPKRTYRYFEKRIPSLPSRDQTYISFNKSLDKRPMIQNDVTVDSSSTTVTTNYDPNCFQNNITVNQYTVPVIIHSDRAVSAETPKPLSAKKQRKKNKKKMKTRSFYKNLKQVNEVTIFLSDESDNECVVVEDNKSNNTPTKIDTRFPKKYNEFEGGDKPESDDDIIYVPPPPVEVIDIEENETEVTSAVTASDHSNSPDRNAKKVNSDNSLPTSKTVCYKPEERKELLITPESTASNDFLENPLTENSSKNFNFSLHGSDFNSQGDFVRPPTKPIENCETESSCSTNEPSRDFSNTVKTIVFDEVEFPREDIFSDKNLESFSSFITPKRNSKAAKECSTSQRPKVIDKNLHDDDDSSSVSSSESDYEHPSQLTNLRVPEDDLRSKRLPNLSPMMPADETPQKYSSKKITASNFFKNSSKEETKHQKKKKNGPKNSLVNPNDNQNDCVSSENADKVKKKKPDSVGSLSENNECEEVSTVLEKEKKKKRKSANSENLQSTSETENQNEKPKKKKKKRDSLNTDKPPEMETASRIPTQNQIEAGNVVRDDTGTKTNEEENENGKETTQSENVSVPLETNDCDENNTGSEKPKKKRKSPSENLPNVLGTDSLEESPEKVKKKKKKKRDLDAGTNLDATKSADTEINDVTEENSLLEDSTAEENIPKNSDDKNRDLLDEENPLADFIVIDTTDKNSDVEIIEPLDTDSDFEFFDNVDGDIKLANCSSSAEISGLDKTVLENSSNSNKPTAIEEFDIERIQGTQSDNPEMWQISHRDRSIYLNMDRNKGPRCNRCRHFGHTAVRCPEKPEPPNCFLCGQPDHREPRCPNKRCTQCGNQGDFSTTYCWKCFKFRHMVCKLCRMKGHIENACPDLWRRYHLTTDEGPIIVSQHQMKPRDQQWCSGCARQGHLEHECNYYSREYPPTTPYIIDYDDNLAQREIRISQRVITSTVTSQNAPRNSIDSYQNMSFNQNCSQHESTSNQLPAFTNPSTFSQLEQPNHLPVFNQLQTTNRLPIPNQLPIPTPLPIPNQLQVPPRLPLPHQLPIPSQLPIPNQLPFLNQVSSSNQLNQCLTPIQLQILSQLPILNQLQTLSMIQNQIPVNPVIPNSTNDTKSTTSVYFDKNYFVKNSGKIDVIDERRMKEIILNMPPESVHEFLTREMEQLRSSNVNPRLLKSKLCKFDKLLQSKKPITTQLLKEKRFWFRVLNMFLFGKHMFGDGRLHVGYLNRYLKNSRSVQLDEHKRRSLLSSYSYIFTFEKHGNVNYYRLMNNLIKRHDEGKFD